MKSENICDLTLHILQTIKPSIILACQDCVNEDKELWRIQENMDGLKIANTIPDFSSARSRARKIKVSKVSSDEQSFQVIEAFHPTKIRRKEGDERLMMDAFLPKSLRKSTSLAESGKGSKNNG